MEENQEQQGETNNNQPTILYGWRALEFSREASRPTSWYVIVIVLWVAFVSYSVWQSNWVQLALAVALGAVVLMLSRLQPREFEHEMGADFIKVGGKMYSYDSYKAFAIVRSGGESKLLLVPKQRLGQGLSLQLGGADVERIRAIMLNRLPEETRDEDLVDQLNRWLKL